MRKTTLRISHVSERALLRLAHTVGPGFPPDVTYLARDRRDPQIVELEGAVMVVTVNAHEVEIAVFSRRRVRAQRAVA